VAEALPMEGGLMVVLDGASLTIESLAASQRRTKPISPGGA